MSWFLNPVEERGALRVSSIIGRDQPVDIGVTGAAVPSIQVRDGCVGIRAAANAQAALTVAGNVAITGTLHAGYGKAVPGALLQTSNMALGHFDGYTTRVYTDAEASSSIRLSVLGATPGAFTDVVTVATAAGRVGVNTTAPQAHLHVAGDVLVEGAVSANAVSFASGMSPFESLGRGAAVTANLTPLTFRRTLIDTQQFAGGVFVPQTGNVYLIPGSSANVVAYNPRANAVHSIGAVSLNLPWLGFAYSGGVTVGTKVVCAPRHNNNVLVIDTLTGTLSQTAGPVNFTGSPAGGAWKCSGAVYAPQTGNVYLIPDSIRELYVYNPSTNTVSNVAAFPWPGSSYPQWFGGALGGDGKIYCAPYNASNVAIIDPVTNLVSYTRALPVVPNKSFLGAVTGPDGAVYFVPATSPKVVCYDPRTAQFDIVGSDLGSAVNKWNGGSVGPDGCIYCAPESANAFLIIDTVTKTTRLGPAVVDGTAAAACRGVVLAHGPKAGEWASYAIPTSPTTFGTQQLIPGSSAPLRGVSHGLTTPPAWMTSDMVNKP